MESSGFAPVKAIGRIGYGLTEGNIWRLHGAAEENNENFNELSRFMG
jgi:hypothetical protein